MRTMVLPSHTSTGSARKATDPTVAGAGSREGLVLASRWLPGSSAAALGRGGPASVGGNVGQKTAGIGFADNCVLGRESAISSSHWEHFAPYTAEFVGAFLLTLIYVCNLTNESRWGVSSNGLMGIAVTTALFHVSGANLNPSISIALLLAGRHEFRVAWRFCMVQVMGGVAAALARYSVSIQNVDFGPKRGFNAFEAMFIELVYTTLLCVVYMNCAAAQRQGAKSGVSASNRTERCDFSGVAIGLCLIAGGYASASVSGTVMNPAIAIGVQLVDLGSDSRSGWGIAYLIPELLGGVLSVALYRVLRPGEFKLAPARNPDGSLGADTFESRSLLGSCHTEVPVSSRITAEFVGTFFIVFTKALNRFGTVSNSGEAWSMAAMLASLVYSLRDVSGAFFNPAATLAAVVVSGMRGAVPPLLGAIYSSTQIFAGIIASSVFAIAVAKEHAGEVAPSSQYHWSALILGETLFTFMFCFITLSVAPPLGNGSSRPRLGDAAGVIVGFCLAAGNMAVGHVTGSALNPAVAIGFVGLKALAAGQISRQCLVYIVCELVGGFAAAGIFMLLHPENAYNAAACISHEIVPESGYATFPAAAAGARSAGRLARRSSTSTLEGLLSPASRQGSAATAEPAEHSSDEDA